MMHKSTVFIWIDKKKQHMRYKKHLGQHCWSHMQGEYACGASGVKDYSIFAHITVAETIRNNHQSNDMTKIINGNAEK